MVWVGSLGLLLDIVCGWFWMDRSLHRDLNIMSNSQILLDKVAAVGDRKEGIY